MPAYPGTSDTRFSALCCLLWAHYGKAAEEGLAESTQGKGQKPGFYSPLKRGAPRLGGISQARVVPTAEKPGFFALWRTVMPRGMSDVSIDGERFAGAKLVGVCRQRFVVGASAPQERAEARTTHGPHGHWPRCARRRASGRLTPAGVIP